MRKYKNVKIIEVLNQSSEKLFVSESGNFVFRRDTLEMIVEGDDGEPENMTEVSYRVQSLNDADFHCIGIELRRDYNNYIIKDGIYYQRYLGVDITKGIRMSPSVVYDIPTTKKYIQLLEDAISMAERVEPYIEDND